MNRIKLVLIIVIFTAIGFGVATYLNSDNAKKVISTVTDNLNQDEDKGGSEERTSHPLSIEALRKGEYPGSDIIIEQTLAPGSNYQRYIASYKSEGLKIYGLLTVPVGERPNTGWPVIIFNHGYIPPDQYQTAERYVAYVDAFARNGYIVFKPDYRGHGNSEGQPFGAYYSPAYTIDVLNALSTLKRYKDADPQKIGMWGHSLGGNITLRAMVVSRDIKAAVLWAGVVGTYDDLMNRWHGIRPTPSSNQEIAGHINSIRQNLVAEYGTPSDNSSFWQSIDPRFFLKDISGPLQFHQGLADSEVPLVFSQGLDNDLKNLGKTVEFYTYPGGDHNISSPNFEIAMQRSIDFFNKYLKGGENG